LVILFEDRKEVKRYLEQGVSNKSCNEESKV